MINLCEHQKQQIKFFNYAEHCQCAVVLHMHTHTATLLRPAVQVVDIMLCYVCALIH